MGGIIMKYKDLTPEQKKFVSNGCGGKGGIVKPPNFIFLASCNHHDFKFWRGHTKKDFNKANRDFYDKMLLDIESQSWYKKPHYHLWAFTYFQSVNVFGKKFFNFADKPKTLADLQMEMLR